MANPLIKQGLSVGSGTIQFSAVFGCHCSPSYRGPLWVRSHHLEFWVLDSKTTCEILCKGQKYATEISFLGIQYSLWRVESKATPTSCINWVFPHASKLKIYGWLDASESYKRLEINSCLEVKKQQSNTSDVASNVCFPVDMGRTIRENGIIFWKAAEWSLYYRVKSNSLPLLPRQAPTCVIFPLWLSTQKPHEGGKSLPWVCTTTLPPALDSSHQTLQQLSVDSISLPANPCPSRPCPALCHQTSASWLSQKWLSWAGREAGRHFPDRCSSGPMDWELVIHALP